MKSILLAGAAILGFANSASATLQIAANINGTLFSCVDNAACDQNAAVGTLQLNNLVLGGVQVNGSIQSQQLGVAGGVSNILNTSSLSVINNTGATVSGTVTVGGTGFTAPTQVATLSGSGTYQNSAGTQAILTWYGDTANAQGADAPNDTPGATLDTFSHVAIGNADSFSTGNVVVPFVTSAPFSLTENAVFTLAAGGTLLSRGQTIVADVAVAEPLPLAVLGVGILGLAMVKRRAW